MRRQIDKAMNDGRAAFQHVDLLPVPQAFTDPKPLKERTNASTMTTLVGACIAGIRRCDELKTASLSREEIREELKAIIASIPKLESTTFVFPIDVVGKQPMFTRVETHPQKR